MNRERYLERARIAFGLDARPRAQALKAWHAKWDGPSGATRQYGGSYSKAASPARFATKAASTPALQPFAVFDSVVGDHSTNNAIVALSSDGRTLTASGYAVKSIAGAGVTRDGEPLVELVTDLGRHKVRRADIRRKG